jgi:hypothetical protein
LGVTVAGAGGEGAVFWMRRRRITKAMRNVVPLLNVAEMRVLEYTPGKMREAVRVMVGDCAASASASVGVLLKMTLCCPVGLRF